MNWETLKICKEITAELRAFPGACLFNEPVKQDHPDLRNYYKKIRNPQDLGTILERLERGEYTEVKAWEKDINQVWLNAESFHGKESYVTFIAHHMSARFQKMKERLEKKKISQWMKHLYLSREKLDRLLLSPPSGIGPVFPIGLLSESMNYTPFSSRELDCLVDASRAFFKPEELAQIAKLMQGEPQMQGKAEEVIINVDELTPKTCHRLRDYFKKKLQDEYPV